MNTRNILIVIKKELKHYFDTPHIYVLISVFLIIEGYFFAQPLFLLNQGNLNSIIDVTPLILTFFIPALTMKLIAEEKKTQTIEVLMTLPLKEEEIIIGKYIASAIVIILAILLMFPYALTIIFLSKPDIGHIIGTYLSMIMTSIAFLSAGLFASTLSSSQITAFIVGFAFCFIFYLSGKITIFLPITLQNIFSYLSTDSHISNMSRGVIDLKDIIYFISIAVFFIYLSIEKLKVKKG